MFLLHLCIQRLEIDVPTFHRLIVLVQSLFLCRMVDRNGKASFLKGPTIPVTLNRLDFVYLWSILLGLVRLLCLRGFPPCPHPSKGFE